MSDNLTVVRFTSNQLIHTPGIINWVLQSGGVNAPNGKPRGIKGTLVDFFPNAPEAAIDKLASGDYAIEGDTVIVVLDKTVTIDVEVADVRAGT